MAAPAGRTLFKKKDGILTLTGDYQIVTWTPNSGGPPTISLPVSNITNLQQTPETAAKVMLKIFEKADNGADPATYLFHFNTSEAKAEAKAIKDVLSKILADMRSNDAGVPRPNVATPTAGDASTPAAAGSGSAAMAFASAVNSQASASTRWFDDNQLKNDIELQQSLMKKDKSLHQTYVEAITTKPESISGAAFNSQFGLRARTYSEPMLLK
ncbi:RNA polymerase II transcription factor B subunit 1 [Metarhizium acridum]|nr:RNA polymerase II transcription factor B subunit 1 [Metarhizium acridum]